MPQRKAQFNHERGINMNELIPIITKTINNVETLACDARALHEYLKVKSRFNDWMNNRIEKYGFQEGVDYLTLTKNLVSGGQAKEYILSIDMAKQIAMVENNDKGAEVRRYFIQCEQIAKEAVKHHRVENKHDAELKRADAMLNNSRIRIAKFVRETVKDIWDYLSPEAKQSYSSYVVETATGQPGLIPLPVVEKSYTASELGAEFGVTANMIGRLANKFGLKRPEYGYEVLDKARGHDKQVPSFRYNETGKAAIGRIVKDDEYIN